MAENKLFTDNGKEIKIRQVKNSSLVEVVWADGGQLPKCFQQKFTSTPLAVAEIKRYLTMSPADKRAQYYEEKKKEKANKENAIDGSSVFASE